MARVSDRFRLGAVVEVLVGWLVTSASALCFLSLQSPNIAFEEKLLITGVGLIPLFAGITLVYIGFRELIHAPNDLY